MRQQSNEYMYAKHHMVETVKAMLKEVAPDIDQYLDEYLTKVQDFFDESDFTYVTKGETKFWATKAERYSYMNEMEPSKLKDLCWEILVHCITKPKTTFTEVLGKVYKTLKLGERQALETVGDMLAVLNTTRFISVVYPMNSEEGVLMITSNITLPMDIQRYLNQLTFILPSITKPVEVLSNSDTGYETIHDGLLLGGKSHDFPLNLGHINRCNSVALRIDDRICMSIEPVFKEKVESVKERTDRYTQWRQMNAESVGLYAQFIDRDIYLTHRYDERGRTYARGHHFNSQGDDYRKSVIELAHREVVAC